MSRDLQDRMNALTLNHCDTVDVALLGAIVQVQIAGGFEFVSN